MSFEKFTALLTAAEFPFVSSFLPRPVMIPGLDSAPHAPRSFTGAGDSHNPEIPQQFYGQNIIPTNEGLMSVGYEQVIPALVGAMDFDQVITLRDVDENTFLFSPARGKNYIYTQNSGAWASVNPFGGWAFDLVTRSYVNGRTFVCYEKKNTYEYDTAAGTFNPVVFNGLIPADVDGIASSNNYNLTWSNITIRWSSLIDPLDFVPNINTGAGNAIPQDVKGPIRCVAAISGGFVLYTTKNAVAALYTNNVRAPFVFREISNAGGVQNPEQVTIDATLGYHYAWTTAGLQKISVNSAETLDPGAADFLAGRIFEEFNLSTLTLTITPQSLDIKVKVAFVSGRFVVISYGKQISPQVYTHAIVYDTILKRWGKLKINHVDCFSFPYPNLIGFITDTPPKRSVGFLQSDGTIQLLIMDYRTKQDQGVLLIGRFQLVRQKEITHQGLELESLTQAYPPNVYLLRSVNGKAFEAPQQLQMVEDGGSYKRYGGPTYSGNGPAPGRTGKNISYLLTGSFQLSTAIITVTRHGSR